MKSKTLWFNALLAALGVVQTQTGVLQTLLTPSQFGWVLVGVAVAGAFLRVLTTEPLSEK